jgi:hypothetical protein
MDQHHLFIGLTLLGLGQALSLPASAHVCNVDLSNPPAATLCDAGAYHPAVAADGTVSINEDGSLPDVNGDLPVGHGPNLFSGHGWKAGTPATLGDSHELAGGDIFTFHLDNWSLVNITYAPAAASGLDAAFSLYYGKLPDEGHDDAPYDALNPAAGIPPQHVASATDKNPKPSYRYHAHDGFRDTLNFTQTGGAAFVGQFDAYANWSLANEAAISSDPSTIPGNWSKVYFLLAVNGKGVDKTEKVSFLPLPPGDYTIAAGAANTNDPANPVYSALLPGTVSVKAVPF